MASSFKVFVTLIVYVFVLPASASTVTVILFSPSSSPLLPLTVTVASESSGSAITLISSTSNPTIAVYDVILALNSGAKSVPSKAKLFKLAFSDFVLVFVVCDS